MSDIPEDVWEDAADAADQMPKRPPLMSDVETAIARAIVAERERCARIAEQAAITAGKDMPENPQPMTPDEQCHAAVHSRVAAYRAVASFIRKPTPS